MALPPIHHERVVDHYIYTYTDCSVPGCTDCSNKVYILEILLEDYEFINGNCSPPVKERETRYRLRARYGKRDGRKLRLHDYGGYLSAWSARTKRDEIMRKKRGKGYEAADEFAGLCLLMADNTHQRIEQTMVNWDGELLEVA